MCVDQHNIQLLVCSV